MVGRSRSILLTSNDDAYMMMMMEEVIAREKKERELGIPLQSWSPRQRERKGGERTVTTLARFASGKRK